MAKKRRLRSSIFEENTEALKLNVDAAEEVIEKAMNAFWHNGYEATSMQILEKEMGINKFSIYSSFGNKNGVFLESLKCYKQKLNALINKLKDSNQGVAGIK